MKTKLSQYQVAILNTLRSVTQTRYTDLMHATGLESADFKFHLRALRKANLVEKTDDGLYELTFSGKDFIGTFDALAGSSVKQPRVNLFIIVKRMRGDGENEYLFQERRRTPFYGYNGVHGGPLRYGEDIEVAAGRILESNAGLIATFETVGFFRDRDYAQSGDALLEDKFFVVVSATDITGELNLSWDQGVSKWLPLREARSLDRIFPSCLHVLGCYDKGEPIYLDARNAYRPEDY